MMKSGIRGVGGSGQDHKLMLYTNDMLAVVTDQLTSLVHLIFTISSYSEFSGCTLSWNKSDAKPLSAPCYSHIMD